MSSAQRPAPASDDFVRAIRHRRVSLHLRQDELADLAGVSERFVFALERGKRSVQLDKVVAVLAALGLHLQLQRGATPWISTGPDAPADQREAGV
jgi:y4mF family transcriptional regulator